MKRGHVWVDIQELDWRNQTNRPCSKNNPCMMKKRRRKITPQLKGTWNRKKLFSSDIASSILKQLHQSHQNIIHARHNIQYRMFSFDVGSHEKFLSHHTKKLCWKWWCVLFMIDTIVIR